MLTDTAIRKAKPAAKPFKLSDERGLFLLVHPNGSKYWRLKYRFGGKEKKLALGVYPDVALADARERRDGARKLLANGTDPSEAKKTAKAVLAAEAAQAMNSFATVADEWLAKQAQTMASATFEKARAMFDGLVFPWIGERPIAEIDAPEMLTLLRRIEERGTHETAHRTKQRCGQVFRYAIATGRASRDPTADLRGALTPVKVEHRAAITDPAKIGELLRAIDGYTGTFVVLNALKLSPLVFLRPGELRKATWDEFDLDAAVWRIGVRMKMKEAHTVPLSSQAVTILRELHPLTGCGRYVFPGARSASRPMSNNALNAALRRMGYDKDTMSAHGFRALASTRLNELGWSPDAIERQLAHAERNKVRAAYNRAQYMEERTRMMQAWADYLDGLRAGATVIPFKRQA
jgi:integrase